MEKWSVSDCDVVISYMMLPQDANPSGNVHGGVIMKHIDSAAGVVALRHARSNVVTASIDRLDFHHPVFIGNLLTLQARINWVGQTSMEIEVRAEAEDPMSGEVRHVASAFLTFVALDADGRPASVPPLSLETPDALRRHKEALARRRLRLAEKEKARQCRADIERCE